MKTIVIFLATVAFYFSALAQNSNVYVDSFALPNSALKDGKISYYNPGGDTTIKFSFALYRNFPPPKPAIRIKAIAVFDDGFEYAASDSIYLSQADFTREDGALSKQIESSFTLESGRKEGVLKIKYQFQVNATGYSGWTPWYYGTKTFTTEMYVPPTTFSGPSQICSDAIYTLSNPGSISLENASGIATLISLGNNQWKITRTGTATGKIFIKSILGTKIYKKEISIGQGKPTSINGTFSNLNWSAKYVYTVYTDIRGEILEIVKEGASTVIFTRSNNNTFSLKTPVKPPQIGPIPKMYVLTVKVRVANPECGTSEWLTKEITVGAGTPLE